MANDSPGPLPDPETPTRDRWRDVLLFALLIFFVIAYFASGYLIQRGEMPGDVFSRALFLSLAASIALYYFLETVARIQRKTWSVAGAGAVFIIILSTGLTWMRNNLEVELRDVTRQRDELTTQLEAARTQALQAREDAQTQKTRLAQSEQALERSEDEVAQLRERVKQLGTTVQVDGQILGLPADDDGREARLEVGLIQARGEIYAGREGEQVRFRIQDVPVRQLYRLFVYDAATDRFKRITQFIDDPESMAQRGIVEIDVSMQ